MAEALLTVNDTYGNTKATLLPTHIHEKHIRSSAENRKTLKARLRVDTNLMRETLKTASEEQLTESLIEDTISWVSENVALSGWKTASNF